MSNVPSELRYTKEHEWVMLEDGVATLGITDHAQTELGDITFVELPEDETNVHQGDELATIESVKAASPVFSPVTGVVAEVNGDLADAPEAVNQDPYGAGWLCRVEITDEDEMESLLTAEQYEAFLEEEENEE